MCAFQLWQVPLLSRTQFDRAAELRDDPERLAQHWSQAGLLRVNRQGQVRYTEGLVLEPAGELSAAPASEAVFLGVADQRHIWAIRVEDLTGPLQELAGLAVLEDEFALGVVTTAIALLNWHDQAAFSAGDGAKTAVAKAGWSRVSTAGAEEFPRTDPAVICLIHDAGEQILLARQQHWPPGRFSVLAGFTEPGESLEDCVRRETREEVGLTVRDVQYLGSQPWPFPRSLMIAFSAAADPSQQLHFLDGEIAEARWFTRTQVRAALAAGDWSTPGDADLLRLPGSVSIARTMLESWAYPQGPAADH